MSARPASTLHIAILGCGAAAAMNAGALRALGVRCSFASRDAEKARRCVARFGGREAFGSYEAALASPGVDAVLVATPPVLHAEQALAALRAGKHVVVEKPAFMRSSDFAAIEDVARAARRQALVAENYHYKPLAFTLRRLVAEGAVGEPLFLNVNALKLQKTGDWRDDPALAGGGALFEGGIHWVNFMAHLGLEVRAARGFAARSGAAERGLVAVFHYAGGAIGTLAHSWEVPSALGPLRLSNLYGREGTITFESNGLFVGVWGRSKRVIFPGVRDLVGRRAMWQDFLAALAGGPAAAYSLALARHDLELVERIYASLE